MAGDLKLWKGSDIAAGQNVKFERKGGWFISKAQALLAAFFVVILIIAAILLTKYFTEESFKPSEPEKEKQSLSFQQENIHPISYEILLNHNSSILLGDVSLVFTLRNSSDEIVLKFMGDEVSMPSLSHINQTSNNTHHELGVKSMEYNKDDNLVTIVPSKTLEPENQYNLTLKFVGKINPEEKGVFKIAFKYPVNESSLEDRWIIGAKLGPGYCGLMFPCVDNTSIRSTFRIKLIKPKYVPSVSNAVDKTTQDVLGSEDLQLDDYEWTPSLPYTSLSYFILPEYRVRTIQAVPTSLNIWYPPYLEKTTLSIAEAANSIIMFFNDYFNRSLPIQRLSIVVIDGLISDNPGTLGVIPLSSTLLYSPAYETFKREEKLFYYLARKICNQWLGNVVKFKSVNDSWLEEGMTLYLADLAASQRLRSYDVSYFMTLIQERVLAEEAVFKTAVTEGNEISPLKGAFIFHMISSVMMPLSFEKGIQFYVEKWNFKDPEPTDLWMDLNGVQDRVDVLKFARSWEKKGYPIVSVDYNNNTVFLEQAPILQETAESNSLWWIPITYTLDETVYSNNTTMPAWLKEEKNTTFSLELNDSWIIVNPSYTGFFRTNYSNELWSRLNTHLRNSTESFPNSVKAQLLDDSFALATYDLLDYSIPLNLSLYFKHERGILPWLTVMKHLNFLSLFMKQTESDFTNFKAYLERLVHEVQADLGYTRVAGEKSADTYLRTKILEFSCRHNLSNGCNKWAEDSFSKWVNQSSMTGSIEILSPELRKIAYCYGNRLYGKQSNMDLFNASRLNIIEPYEEFDILTSLTCTSDQQELRKILEQSLDVSDTYFSTRRTVEIWHSLQQNQDNSLAAFDFVKSNWPSIIQKFHKENEIINAILEGSTYALSDNEHLNDMEKLKSDAKPYIKKDRISENNMNKAIEKVRFNINWKSNHLNYVRKWFTRVI